MNDPLYEIIRCVSEIKEQNACKVAGEDNNFSAHYNPFTGFWLPCGLIVLSLFTGVEAADYLRFLPVRRQFFADQYLRNDGRPPDPWPR